ncbi:MAG: SIMPL domain-containing protein [Chloroflexi bacterium]|nr:SIMPL domain-containing protein [Chloroflexota bacterium]
MFRASAIVLSAAVLAGLASWTPARAQTAPDQPSGIHVVGEGIVRVAPDLARATFGVDVMDPSLSQALAAASAQMNAVVDRLVQAGVAREDIQTARFSADPVYDTRGVDAPTLRGYRVSNAVTATIRSIGSVGAIIDQAVAAGANRVEGVSFGTSRMTELKAQARAGAMSDARAKAEQLASLAGVSLGGVVAIVESDATGGQVQRAAPMAAAAAPSTPIEPGQLEVRTVVRVVWSIG